MKFIKMNGTGNDFVVVDNFSASIKIDPSQVSRLCDRHFGIGADGLILVERSLEGGDCFMNYINADGSFAEMCGNGARCTADFMVRFKGFDKRILELDTYGGRKQIEMLPDHMYTVNMGAPKFAPHKDFPDQSLKIEGVEWFFVSMGNPHAVGFYDSADAIDKVIETIGAKIEGNVTQFPNKINVNFVARCQENHYVVKTYERGSGPTLACGTGASASYAWLHKLGKSTGLTRIDVPGGVLNFNLNQAGEILMTGPSQVAFAGEI